MVRLLLWQSNYDCERTVILTPSTQVKYATAPHVIQVFSKGSAAPCCTTHTGSPSTPLISAKVFSPTPTIAGSVTCTPSQAHMCHTVTIVVLVARYAGRTNSPFYLYPFLPPDIIWIILVKVAVKSRRLDRLVKTRCCTVHCAYSCCFTATGR